MGSRGWPRWQPRRGAAEPGAPRRARGVLVSGVSSVRYLSRWYSTDMPSTKKRITVYLDDDQYARIERFCEATGESRASAVAELIDAAAPMLERMIELAGALKAAPDDVRATFAGAAEQLEDRYAAITADAEDFWKTLESLAEGRGPRPVTRGPE